MSDPAGSRAHRAVVDSLAEVALVDQHCHGMLATALGPDDRNQFRRLCTESDDARLLADVPTALAYRRMLRALAVHLDCASDEESVLRARGEREPLAHAAELLSDAGIRTLLLDDGYPPADAVLPPALLEQRAKVTTYRVLRLEPQFERMLGTGIRSVDEARERVRALVREARGAGVVGLKTVAGYRTGLGIRRPDPAAATASLDVVQAELDAHGSVRLGHKALLDILLLDAFEVAGAEQLPVQVHVGYGDTDADLRTASPLELRDVLEDRRLSATQFVLLHGCWPFVREGAYLAGVYGNAWLDVSYGIPFLSRRELVEVTRAAIGVAPLSRIVYSSDGSSLPELHWSGAREGRHAIATALGGAVDDGDLDLSHAVRYGQAMLAGTASRLYGLDEHEAPVP
jgi:predicted TIM-barrel fold metal-dependent hydrolase